MFFKFIFCLLPFWACSPLCSLFFIINRAGHKVKGRILLKVQVADFTLITLIVLIISYLRFFVNLDWQSTIFI